MQILFTLRKTRTLFGDSGEQAGTSTSKICMYCVHSFRKFFISLGRKVVTKLAGFEDHYGNRDMEDITHNYKMLEGGPTERVALLNAVRGSERAKEVFEYKEATDVKFHLEDID